MNATLQLLIVIAVLLGAVLYLARHLWQGGGPACTAGCAGCGSVLRNPKPGHLGRSTHLVQLRRPSS